MLRLALHSQRKVSEHNMLQCCAQQTAKKCDARDAHIKIIALRLQIDRARRLFSTSCRRSGPQPNAILPMLCTLKPFICELRSREGSIHCTIKFVPTVGEEVEPTATRSSPLWLQSRWAKKPNVIRPSARRWIWSSWLKKRGHKDADQI